MPIRRYYAAVVSAVAGLTLWLANAQAAVTAAPLFTDHAVLQRGGLVPVWGRANPGEDVTVIFAGQTLQTVADATGSWEVHLAALPANATPATLTISGENTLTFNDILVGDVWLASGQSNMEWAVGSSDRAAEEIAAGEHPLIRMFAVPHATALTPQSTCDGKWAVSSPATVGQFSAVAYYYARTLQEALQIPVGVIDSSYGGTRAESWVSLAGLQTLPTYRDAATLAAQALPPGDATTWQTARDGAEQSYPARRTAWQARQDAADPGQVKHWMAPATDTTTDNWRTIALPCPAQNNDLGFFVGSMWFRKTVTIPADWVGQKLTLRLGAIDEVDETYVNGVAVGRTWFETPEFWKVPRVYELPPDALAAVTTREVTITVRVLNLYYGLGLFGPDTEMSLRRTDAPADEAGVSLSGEWRYRDGLAMTHADLPGKPPAKPSGNGAGTPASLFNGMIAPLVPPTGPGAIRGVIWYQGESNATDAVDYAELLGGLVADWRRVWGIADLPFGIVQLPNYMAAQTKPVEKASWAELRAAQAKVFASVPHTTLAVTLDLGEAESIHPPHKQEVGRRLALGMLATTYGQPKIVAPGAATVVTQATAAALGATGPHYRSAERDGADLLVHFHLWPGIALKLKGDLPPVFAVAGADKVFHWATARIDGDSLRLTSPAVPTPVAARYAWANNPAATLYDSADLPAAPFRTDNWPDCGVAGE